MKRLVLILLVVLFALAGAFVIAAPQLVSIEVVRRSLAYEIAGWSGEALTFDGTPTVAFTPYLTVTFPKVGIGSNQDRDTLLVMDSLVAQIPILPLIFGGHIEPSAFEFHRPIFHFSVDADGKPNWTLPRGLDETSRVRRLDISDGEIHYADGLGRVVAVTAVNGRLKWPDTAKAATLSGRATWQGETVRFDASLGTFRDLIAGKAANLILAIQSAPLTASFGGTIRNADGRLSGNGAAAVSTPSLQHLARLFGSSVQENNAFGAISMSGTASFGSGMMSVSGAALTIDGNQAEGALSLDSNGARPALQGTLAFDSLDLSPYQQSARNALGALRASPDRVFERPEAARLDVDLRLSADSTQIGSQKLGRTATSVAIRNGRLDLVIGEMQLYGGRVSASLTAELLSDTPSGSLQARIDALPLKDALKDLFQISALKGLATGTLNVSARGDSWNRLIGSLSGTGNGEINNGSLDGIRIRALQHGAGTRDSLQAEFFSGSSSFSSARANITLNAGHLAFEPLVIKGDGYRIDMAGDALLFHSEAAASGLAIVKPSATSEPSCIPFLVGGDWSAPKLMPDLSNLSNSDSSPLGAACQSMVLDP